MYIAACCQSFCPIKIKTFAEPMRRPRVAVIYKAMFAPAPCLFCEIRLRLTSIAGTPR
jgi:hypothetical protein